MMKIFELRHGNGEKEWFTGHTNLEALVHYVTTTDCDLYDLADGELVELPESEWEKHNVTDETESAIMTFAQWMKEDGGRHPDMIAGTMY